MVDHSKFLQLLAKEINRGADKFSFDSLKTYLFQAVEVLPDGKLKDVLQKQSQENAEYLWNQVKPEKKCSVEVEFNLFNKDSLEETLKKISQLHSYKEQVQYLSQVALCFPCNQVFESLLTAQKMESPDQSNLEVLSKVTELYGRLTVGCQNSEVLNELMKVFLSEIDKINDKFKTSNEHHENWLDFKDIIHRFLIHCHVKRKTQEDSICKDNDIQSKEWTQYRDVLAAIIAIYIDVIIAIGQINEEVNNHISNIVYLLLGDSPSHILDTANQIFTLDSSTIKIVFPFLRKVFDTTRTCTKECPNYIKYACLAWKVQHYVRNLEMESLCLKKTVCSLLPPQNFLSWLTDVDNSLIQDFDLRGLIGQKITDQILHCEDEEKIEKMLDLAGSPEKLNKINEDSDQNNAEDNIVENDSNDPLFFVDAEGSSELLDECQEQEFTNSTNEKMLKTQINTLLEKRGETGSEDEKYDFDINLEDNENEATFDFGDAESKNNDDVVPDPSIPDNTTQGVSEGENEININTSHAENESLTQSGRKRRKRKSQTPSKVSEEETKVKSSKKKRISKKRRSLLKTA